MIKLILTSMLFVLSCGSVKTNNPAVPEDSIVIAKNVTAEDLLSATKVPACINKKIDSFKLKEPHERPQRVVQYIYKGEKVYYIVMPCCDFFNEVYDDKCNFLGSPDGGFTGKGDGKLPDFFAEAKNEKLVWQAAK